jgi:hypothetical protein
MKTPEFPIENPSVLSSVHSTQISFTAREYRILHALLNSNHWINRESIDRIAGASNGPQVIQNLRRKITGYDGLEMIQFPALDRDGKHCRVGHYRFTPIGRERVQKYLEAHYEL